MQFVKFGWQRGGVGHVSESAADLTADLAAFGLANVRTGLAQRHILGQTGQRFENIEANAPVFERVTIAGREHLGLVVQPAATPLVENSSNLEGWSTTGSPTVVYTASGGLAGAGYTTITGTGSAWTVSKALTSTSGARSSRVRCFAPAANSSAITLSQDGGSTTSTVTADSQDTIHTGVVLGPQTTSDPTLRVAGSGTDTVIIYDFQHGKASAPYKWLRPQGDTPAGVGATTVSKVVSPAEIRLAIVYRHVRGASDSFAFDFGEGTNTNRCAIYNPSSGTDIRFYTKTSGGTVESILGVTSSSLIMIEAEWTATNVRARLNKGSWVAQSSRAVPTFTRMDIGTRTGGNNEVNHPIAAIRDDAGTLLGPAGTTWNETAMAAFEATL